MSVPRAIPLLLLTLSACRGCGEEEVEPTMTLPEAADEAIFASVEKLGAHRCMATFSRKDVRDGVAAGGQEQAVDIAWRDWDRFKVTRLTNGEPSSEVIIVGGRPFARTMGGRWEEKEDAETYRVQLQSTWDTWDEALEPFGDRIALTEVGRELIEGRWSRRFAISLKPAPAATGRRAAFTPRSLSGTVWLDELTAVRLLAEVEGVLTQGNLQRTITLRLVRSDFGEDLGIRAPELGGANGRRPRQDGSASP